MSLKDSHIRVLETTQLSIGYHPAGRSPIVLASELDLSVGRGEVIGLLGPNGSGKSTLLRTLAGLQPAITGSVRVMGQPVRSNQIRQTARLLSVVLTDRIDVRNLSVFQLVSMGRYPHTDWLGRNGSQDRDRIREALVQVRMQDFADRFYNELSDGEQQRVLLAKALAQDTPLIILDEPTAHLDLPNRISSMRLLRKLADETGKSILFSTHDLDLAMSMANRLWLLRKGESLISGSPDELLDENAIEKTFISGTDYADRQMVKDYFESLKRRDLVK